jgi:hypothetical protein
MVLQLKVHLQFNMDNFQYIGLHVSSPTNRSNPVKIDLVDVDLTN